MNYIAHSLVCHASQVQVQVQFVGQASIHMSHESTRQFATGMGFSMLLKYILLARLPSRMLFATTYLNLCYYKLGMLQLMVSGSHR